ncbi:MAG: cation:proton antiporter family protein, partial [Nanoarchaeota archaeon]
LIGPITLNMIKNAILLSIIVMIIKPLIVMCILKLFGYTKKTNFMTALSLAQVSEFSLILILVGFGFGQVNVDLMNLTILVALITIFLSTYGLNFSDYLSHKLLKYLNIFDGKIQHNEGYKNKTYDVILFGYHRIGYKLFETIKKSHMKFLIVDYNPKTIISLAKNCVDCTYGDAGNKTFLKEIGLDKAKIVISTLPDYQSNLTIFEALKELKSSAIFIGTAEDPRIALSLYEAGADYVIVPHHLGGEYAANLIREFGTNKKRYNQMGRKHLETLRKGKKKSNYVD